MQNKKFNKSISPKNFLRHLFLHSLKVFDERIVSIEDFFPKSTRNVIKAGISDCCLQTRNELITHVHK